MMRKEIAATQKRLSKTRADQRELEALSPSNRRIMKRVYALEDAARRAEATFPNPR